MAANSRIGMSILRSSKANAACSRALLRRRHLLSIRRRYQGDWRREPGMRKRFNRAMFDLDARWIMSKVVIGVPIPGRPDRPWRKTAAAIRTDVGENLIDAEFAERAFETADHGQI